MNRFWKWVLRVLAPIVLIFGLISVDHADALIKCSTWVTVWNSSSTYSECHYTDLTLPGIPNAFNLSESQCWRYKTWKRLKYYISYYGTHWRGERTYRETEVQIVTKTCISYWCYTQYNTVPGSHQSTLLTNIIRYGGPYYCTW